MAATVDVTLRTRQRTSTPEDVARRISYPILTEAGRWQAAAGHEQIGRYYRRLRPHACRPSAAGKPRQLFWLLPTGVVPGHGPRTRERALHPGVQMSATWPAGSQHSYGTAANHPLRPKVTGSTDNGEVIFGPSKQRWAIACGNGLVWLIGVARPGWRTRLGPSDDAVGLTASSAGQRWVLG
jgi:hypothetical protein